MIYAIFFVTLVALLGGGITVWIKFFKAIREWPASTKFVFGKKTMDTPEEPFFSWWQFNSAGMGGGNHVVLDVATKRKIDVVCQDMLAWVYQKDPAGVDFEAVTADRMSGDCEDFARVLALRLIEVGIPAGALTLGMGFHPRAGWHVICLLRTDQGDYMAENGAPFFRPWNEHGFAAGMGGPVTGLMSPQADGYYYDVSAA